MDAMKIHPMSNKRNSLSPFLGLTPKKLRRLPHIFSRVLELPFRADANVSVYENSDCFRFTAETNGIGAEIRAHTIQIHPGVIKVVVRELGSLPLELALDELDIDVWRYRLPEATRPELASAGFVGGKLTVTIPKGEIMEKNDGSGDGVWGGKSGGFQRRRRPWPIGACTVN